MATADVIAQHSYQSQIRHAALESPFLRVFSFKDGGFLHRDGIFLNLEAIEFHDLLVSSILSEYLSHVQGTYAKTEFKPKPERQSPENPQPEQPLSPFEWASTSLPLEAKALAELESQRKAGWKTFEG